ncbi:MAG: YkoP family protein [Anaerolineae bacterium]
MRALVRAFDRFLCQATGVFEFCDDPECLVRLQGARAPHDLSLSDGTQVRAGAPVLMLHLWNEHLPHPAANGPDLQWAARVHRMLTHSLREVAQWMVEQPEGEQIEAVGGITVLALSTAGRPTPLIRHLGFDIFPYRRVLGRFGEFWENFYTWAIMWTFNPLSLRGRSLFRLRRAEIWMSREAFLRRYKNGPDNL